MMFLLQYSRQKFHPKTVKRYGRVQRILENECLYQISMSVKLKHFLFALIYGKFYMHMRFLRQLIFINDITQIFAIDFRSKSCNVLISELRSF